MKRAQKLILTITISMLISLMIMSVSYAATATIITDTLRLRKAPTIESNILRNLDEGDKVEIISKEGDWYKVSFNGSEGYIAAEYVKVEGEVLSTTDKKEETVNTAVQQNTNVIVVAENAGEIRVKANVTVYILPVLISSSVMVTDQATPVKVTEILNNWSKVEVSGTTGWVLNKNIENFNEAKRVLEAENKTVEATAEPVVENSTKIGYVSVSSANVRSDASLNAEVVKTLVLNNEVTILEKVGDWYKIQNGNAVSYIYASLVSDKKTEVTSRSSLNRTSNSTQESSKPAISAPAVVSASGNAVVDYAKQFIGYSYVYAGSGPTSFDCSGFTMYIFKQFGINLPHNAVTQSNYGTYVSKENLAPGDLVIFNNYGNTSIGHAAIYIGDGRIVHAANSKRGVTTDTILSGYYDARFVEGRRLL